MPHYGVFVDPSEYRRNNLDFEGDRLTALVELAGKNWITLLQTDVSVSETRRVINRDMDDACKELRKSKLKTLKSLTDERMRIFKKLPTATELADNLVGLFQHHLKSGPCTILDVSNVDPAVIFAAYFRNDPPFDNLKKKKEFPDAFTLQRLVMWADENDTVVYVVGPDPDLERFCGVWEQLQYFGKIEELLHHINHADKLVQRLQKKPQDVADILSDFVREEFASLTFRLEYNPHGDVENVSVLDVEIQDIYALEVEDEEVRAEAEFAVDFSADFSYEDLGSGFYDKETGKYFMTEYVDGQIENTYSVSIRFNFSVDADNISIVSSISFREDTITVREEDRGDYGMYK